MKKTYENYTLDECVVRGQVGKAIEVFKLGLVYMIPISQVIQLPPCNTKIVMTAWIAKQKGLI